MTLFLNEAKYKFKPKDWDKQINWDWLGIIIYSNFSSPEKISWRLQRYFLRNGHCFVFITSLFWLWLYSSVIRMIYKYKPFIQWYALGIFKKLSFTLMELVWIRWHFEPNSAPVDTIQVRTLSRKQYFTGSLIPLIPFKCFENTRRKV